MDGSFGSLTSLVVSEGTVAAGDEKDAFDLVRRVLRAVVLQLEDASVRREVAYPYGVTRLFWLAWRASGNIRDRCLERWLRHRSRCEEKDTLTRWSDGRRRSAYLTETAGVHY